MKKHTILSTNFPLTIVMILLMIFQSCKKNDLQQITSVTAENNNIAALTQAVAASSGLTADKVEYVKNDEEFVVDGDATISLKDAKARFTSGGTSTSVNEATHRKGYYVIASAKVNTIKIYCDATVPAAWITALDAAIKNWNASGSKVYIQRITTSTGATTKVTTTYSVSSTVATAAYPSYYGNPGNRITINTYKNNLETSKKIFAITHELGHTLGLTHTNGTYGSLITGTPTTDPYSVMNAVCLYWKGFTAYDLKAIRTIYPI